jgi:hypothetical protein
MGMYGEGGSDWLCQNLRGSEYKDTLPDYYNYLGTIADYVEAYMPWIMRHSETMNFRRMQHSESFSNFIRENVQKFEDTMGQYIGWKQFVAMGVALCRCSGMPYQMYAAVLAERRGHYLQHKYATLNYGWLEVGDGLVLEGVSQTDKTMLFHTKVFW